MAASDVDRGMIEQQISNWVRQFVAFPDKSLHGKCTKVVLRHVNIDRRPQGDVNSFAVRMEEGAEEEGIDPLINKIADSAQGDANDLNQGVQTYAVFAYYDGDKTYVPRKNFRVAPTDVEMQRDLSPSETPDARGLTAQLMRHVEAIQRTATISGGHLFQTMQLEMKRMAEMNEKFGEQQIEMLVLVQDLIDNSHRRRLEERSEEANLAIKEETVSKLAALAPVIINRLAGKQIVPEEDRSLMLMANLLEGLDDDQQAMLYKTLKPQQLIALAEVFSAYEQRKSKWLGREKSLVGLGKRNAPPPPRDTESPARDELLSPESEVVPMPLALTLTERMKRPSGQSSDPKIRQLESDAQSIADRLRSQLKKPPTGEKPR